MSLGLSNNSSAVNQACHEANEVKSLGNWRTLAVLAHLGGTGAPWRYWRTLKALAHLEGTGAAPAAGKDGRIE